MSKVPTVEDIKYTHIIETMTMVAHHFYLSDEIDEPKYYVDMIHTITEAGANDTIVIHLNTPGGHLHTGIQLINAMKLTEAHVVCSLEATSHSLGTIIFLSADERIVQPNSMMMFHNYHGGTYGKGNEQVAELEATIRWFEQIARTIYVPFLTTAEVNRILKGEDLWLLTDDIITRLKRLK